MRRRRLLISLLILAAALLPAGVHWYYQPVKAEDLNSQLGCCGPRTLEFRNGSITLLTTPHPEVETAGSALGSYRMEGETLIISHQQETVEYVLDHLGARQKSWPSRDDWMREFYDSGSWKVTLARLSHDSWQGIKDYFKYDLRRDPVTQSLTAAVAVLAWWLLRKSRRKRSLG